MTDNNSSAGKQNASWRGIIYTIPEEQLREFIEEYASRDPEFRDRILIHFTEYDKTGSAEKYRTIVSECLNPSSGRDDYIDLHDDSRAIDSINELLAKAWTFLQKGIPEEAFEIAAAVISECLKAAPLMDDSGGEVGSLINDSFRIIIKILEQSKDDQLRQKIFNWLYHQMDDPGHENSSNEEILEGIIFNLSETAEEISKAHRYIDNQIKKAEQLDGLSKEYRIKKFMKYKVHLLIKEDKLEEAGKIIDDNLEIDEFREIRINEYIAEGDTAEAVRLIEEAIKTADEGKMTGKVRYWKERLNALYEQQEDVESSRKIILDLFITNGYDIVYFRKLKSTFTDEEWLKERDKFIPEPSADKGDGTFPHSLAKIFIEERQTERLFEMVKQKPDVNILLSYSEHLKDDYSTDLLRFYERAVRSFTESMSGPGDIHILIHLLKKISTIPGGSEILSELKDDMPGLFGDRPDILNMLDELLNEEG